MRGRAQIEHGSFIPRGVLGQGIPRRISARTEVYAIDVRRLPFVAHPEGLAIGREGKVAAVKGIAIRQTPQTLTVCIESNQVLAGLAHGTTEGHKLPGRRRRVWGGMISIKGTLAIRRVPSGIPGVGEGHDILRLNAVVIEQLEGIVTGRNRFALIV